MSVNEILALPTLASNVVLVAVVLIFLLSKVDKTALKLWLSIGKFLQGRAIFFAFLVASIATSGSLYFSEVAGFEPCKLCWFQRIFMYPLVIILGTALIKKLKDVFEYVLPLALIGGVIAAYHYYYQVTGTTLIPCSSLGFSVSCSERFFTYYGYITIPWMSLSAFALIISLGILKKFNLR